MMITNFTNAGIYYDRHACYNLDPSEIIAPKSPLFSVQDEEKEFIQFEKKPYYANNQQRLVDALHGGIITEFDKITLALIATFSINVTSRSLSELFTLMGYATDGKIRAKVQKSVKRLSSFGLINSFRFCFNDTDDRAKSSTTRIYTLCPNGFRLLKSLGVHGFYYNPFEVSTRTIAEHKNKCSVSQAVVCWLKHFPAISFSFTEQITSDESDNNTIRPGATIHTESENVYIESVRRTESQKAEIIKKLPYYKNILANSDTNYTIVIVCEDELHIREIYDCFKQYEVNVTDNVIFTHDLKIASDFQHAFYMFEGDNLIPLYIVS